MTAVCVITGQDLRLSVMISSGQEERMENVAE